MESAQTHPIVHDCLQSCGILHKVISCDPNLADTAVFCDHYGFSPDMTANAIVTASKSDPVKYACCVILATTKLDVNKKVCQLLGVKRASFASSEQTIALTGMEVGGVTPFGLPQIPIYFDSKILDCSELVLGGGNRVSKIILNPHELNKLPNSSFVEGLAVSR